MASIRTSLELIDNITSPLLNITSALNMTVSAFEEMDAAANNSFDPSNFEGVRDHINAATIEIEEMVQSINEAEQQQQNLNNSMNQGVRSASGLEKKLLGVAATYASLQGVQRLLNLSDTAILTEARLELIVDDGGSVEELQNMIYASAQNARASYADMSATIAKLGMMAGKAFTDNEEMIAFAELMNKNFVVGGSSAAEQASAMYQLTQAMASGRLQGDEYVSIIENAPLLAKSIEDYMRNVEGATGTMKEWASEGMLTADIIKNAMFYSAEQVNEQFESMPMTFGQVATSIKNQALMAFDPVLEKLNDIANSERFEVMVAGITNALVFASGIAVGFLDMLTQAGQFMVDNWSIISPLIYGVAAALGLYTGYLIISNAVQAISTGIQTAHAIAIALKTGATIADVAATNNLTVAQWALNSALLASPVTWILIMIIAIIAALYATVAAINKVTGSSISATGIITGALAVAAAFIGNLFVTLINFVIDIFVVLWNFIAAFANFFANVFNDPVGAIARLFFDLVDTVLSLLQSLAKAIDTIFGSNLAGSVQGWRDSLGGWVDDTFGKGVEVMAELDSSDLHLGRFEYGAAWDAGYAFGEGIEDTISNFSIGDLFDTNIPDPSDYALGYDGSSIPSNIADIADNTGAIKNSVDISQEDLKYMRDLAEQETVNKYTTAEINIDMSGMTNQVNNEMDLDGVVDYMVEKTEEAIDIISRGVHE